MPAHAIGCDTALLGTSFLWHCILSLICRRLSPRMMTDTFVSTYTCCFMVECHGCILLDNVLAQSYKFWYALFQVQSHINDVSFHNGSHTSVVKGENFPIPENDCNSFLSLRDILVSVHNFFGSGYTPPLVLDSPKIVFACIWNNICFINFQIFSMAYLHYLSQSSVIMYAVSIVPYNYNTIWNAKYIWKIFEYFIIFFWNMPSDGATTNGSLINLSFQIDV